MGLTFAHRVPSRYGFPIPVSLPQPLHPVAGPEKTGFFDSSPCLTALTLSRAKRMLGPKSRFPGWLPLPRRAHWTHGTAAPHPVRDRPTGIPMPRTDLTWRTLRPAEGFYTSHVETTDGLPVRTFLPTGYEPNYPYPLLVFLHGHGGNEEQVLRLAPRVSRRNYIAIGLRGPHLIGTRPDGRGCYGWGDPVFGGSLIEDYLVRAVEQTRRQYHVHSERIYLAGVHEGA